MPEKPDLEHLLRDVAKQDMAAFRLLYDMTSPRLMGVALRICRERQMAEDVLQDIYVQVWQRAGSYDPTRASAMAWMMAITRNRAIDHIRRLGRPGSPGRTAGEYEVDKLPSLSMRADMNVEVMALAECLERLSPRHRDAVLRAYYDGWSREELASHFDIPVNTIKAWLRRGLIALRRCMDGDTR